MTYRLKKENVERVADTEESKNYLMSLGYKIIESPKPEKTDDKAEDDSAENNTDTKDKTVETSPKSKRGKTANKTE